jgi:triosephosphate isomerase
MRYLIANLKMKLVSEQENSEYCVALAEAMKGVKKKSVQAIVCPSFPFLELFKKKLPKGAALGAQDVWWEERGAYTGAVSPVSLSDLGVSFALVGHSERREFCGETDEMTAKKITACLRNDIQPILCVGETEAERREEKTFVVIARQVKTAFAGISREDFRRGIIAYEPRWAIGTNRTPSSDEILEVAISIRKSLVGMFDRSEVDAFPLLYGGSVTLEQMNDMCLRPGLSGVLVGRESLNPKEVAEMMRVLGE